MAQPLYTPFMAQAGANLGNAFMQYQGNKQKSQSDAQMKELTKSAYMGDQQALAQLTAVNPQVADQIQRSHRQTKMDELSMAGAQQKSQDRQRSQNIEADQIKQEILIEASKMATFEEASAYANRRTKEMESVLGPVPPLSEKAYNQVRQAQGGGDSAPFAGTGMDAQVGNLLVKGTEDPEFRKTPEYARAWQLANEPKIVRTPQGDMILRPELPAGFKPPTGSAKELTTEEQRASGLPTPTPGAPKVIQGTEKISTDQKAYNKDYGILHKSYLSMKNYTDILAELGPQASIGPLNAKDTKKLESAYKRAMLDAKETNNLGVLNGPDLQIMESFMGDPIGPGAIFKGKGSLVEGGAAALKQITDNYDSLNGIYEGSTVKTKPIRSEKSRGITASDSNMSMKIDGKTWTFPDIESYNAAKEAAGL